MVQPDRLHLHLDLNAYQPAEAISQAEQDRGNPQPAVCRKLRFLDLSDNNLTSIYADVGLLQNMQYFAVTANRVRGKVICSVHSSSKIAILSAVLYLCVG